MKDQVDEPAARSNGPAHNVIALRVVNLSKGDRLKLEAVKTAEGQKLIAVTGQHKTSEGEIVDTPPPCLISIEQRSFDIMIEALQDLVSGDETGLLAERNVYFEFGSFKLSSKIIRFGQKKYFPNVWQIWALTKALRELREILKREDSVVIRPLNSFLKPPK